MRTVRLARVAADAEILLLRQTAKGYVRRAVYGAVAAVFGIGVLILVHVLVYIALEQFAHLSSLVSAAIVMGFDVVVAGVFGLLAAGSIKDPVIVEARMVRDNSLRELRQSFNVASMVAPAARVAGNRRLYAVALAAIAARFLGRRK